MRYLKRYNENNSDIHHAVVKIKEHFSEEIVSEMLADEIKEWADEDNYKSINSGEAEEMVLHQLIFWYEKEFKQLNDEDKNELEKELKQIYKTFL